MKKVLVLTAAIATVAGLAFAQSGGSVSLYSDQTYSDCNLNETVFVLNYVYVVHDMAPTGNTAEFMVVNNYVSPTVLDAGVTYSGLHLGDLYTGVTITYVGCKTLPFLLATASFVPVAAHGECYSVDGSGVALRVVADPVVDSGRIEIVQCDGVTILYATGGVLTVNGGPDSVCSCTIGTEETTWSKIKALYQ